MLTKFVSDLTKTVGTRQFFSLKSKIRKTHVKLEGKVYTFWPIRVIIP